MFKKPDCEASIEDQADKRLPITLICDNIRDPGNLGTILRSAAAAACEKVLLTKGKAALLFQSLHLPLLDLYTGWPRKNRLTYFPWIVFAMNGNFVRQCRTLSFSLVGQP